MFSNFLCLFQLVMVTDFLRLQFPVLSCDDTYPRWPVLWCCEMLCKFVLTVLKSQFFNCQICISIPAAVHSHSLTCVFLPEVPRSPVFWCWVSLVLSIFFRFVSTVLDFQFSTVSSVITFLWLPTVALVPDFCLEYGEVWSVWLPVHLTECNTQFKIGFLSVAWNVSDVVLDLRG